MQPLREIATNPNYFAVNTTPGTTARENEADRSVRQGYTNRPPIGHTHNPCDCTDKPR